MLVSVGMVCGIVGLLPWLIQGAQLPLQNLWADQTMPDDMPMALLPFSQYYLGVLAGILVIPWLLAGIVARGRTLKGTAQRLVTLAMGVVVVQLLALAQTSVAVGTGLRFTAGRGVYSFLYLLGLVGGSCLAMGLGVMIFLLLARANRTDAVLGLGMAAVVVSPWARELSLAGQFTELYTNEGYVLGAWVAAAFIGLMIGWNGVWPARALLTSAASVAIWWIGRAVLWGLQGAVGSRSSLGRPVEMAKGFIDGFAGSLQEVHRSPVIVAVLVALVMLVVMRAHTAARIRHSATSA